MIGEARKINLRVLDRVREAVRDEAGDVLCTWSADGSQRHCINVFQGKSCRCEKVALAAIRAMEGHHDN